MSRFIEPDSYFEPQPSVFKPMGDLADMSVGSGPGPRSSTAPLEQNSLFDRSQTHSTAPTSSRPKHDTSEDHGRTRTTTRRSSEPIQQELRDKILSRLRESEAGEDTRRRSRSGSHSSASSIVSSVFRLLDHQTARANTLEESSQRDRDTLLNGMKEMRESRTRAETELTKTRTELQMYKIRFEDIRQELLRAQQLIDQLNKARDEAEEGWAKDREALRRISTQQMMENARSEGQKEGWRQGIERGKWLARLQRASDDTEHRIVYEDEEDEPRTPVTFSNSRRYEEYERLRNATHYRSSRPIERRGSTAPIQVLASPRPVRPSSPPQARPVTAPIRSPESIQVINMNRERPPSVLAGRRQAEPQVRSSPQSVHSVARPASVAPSRCSHRSVEIPPEGYIPTLGPNARIALPPPHELSRPAEEDYVHISPPARTSSILSRRRMQSPNPTTRSGGDTQREPKVRTHALHDSRLARPAKPVMPMHQYDDLFGGGDEPDAEGSPRSNDSWGSTRISDYELISPPRNNGPSAVAAGKRREEGTSTLSPALHREDSQISETQRMVEEWRSANSDVVSPLPQRHYVVSGPTSSRQTATLPNSRAGPSRAAGQPTSARRETGSSSSTNSTRSTTSSDRMFRSSNRIDMRASIYTDGPSLFLGPFDSRPQSTAPSTSTHGRQNVQRSGSTATVPGISVEPPSHSPTDSAGTALDPVLLTPDHANQPLVFPLTRDTQHLAPNRPKDPAVISPSHDLPPGFVLLSPATPNPERNPGRGSPSRELSSSYGGTVYA